MTQNVTAHELAAQFQRAARDVDDAVGKVVEAAAYAVRADAFERVTRDGEDNDNAAHRYAARQIEATPTGDLEMQVGYDTGDDELTAAIEYGSATIAPGGQLSTALETEAPRFARTVVLAALKRMR